ncbi:hypothetical protein IQ07DRAFT_590512 [Pyrenochaeta sp. DS3sAY3a]|nr:hypothetical protein IQ07DRAFT_590512 [Pyrenochaeta sp. DS3sAY3a]
MGLMWTKMFGGRHAGKLIPPEQCSYDCSKLTLNLGGGVVADRHGVRRAPMRISCGRFSCFR